MIEPVDPRTVAAEAHAPEPAPATIAFLGLFGSPNLGNEATLTAFLRNVAVRRPGTGFVCIAPRQSRIEQVYGIPLIDIDPWPVARWAWRIRPLALRTFVVDLIERLTERRRRSAARARLHGVDCLVIPGTGLIDDFGQRPHDMPTHLNRWTRAAKACGVRILFLSVGVSTVQHPLSRALFASSLQRAAYCSFRDPESLANARALGFDGAAVVCPDLAFSLPTADLHEAQTPSAVNAVGVGVMGYFGWNAGRDDGQRIYDDYLDRLCDIVRALLARGLDVHLLTGDTRADDATVQIVARRCTPDRPGMGRLKSPPITDFRDAVKAIAEVDLVVASRFHNLVFGLMLRRTAISIGYSDKNDALMRAFGLSHYCHDIEAFEPDLVLQQIDAIRAALPPEHAGIPDLLSAAQNALALQYEAIIRPNP